MDKKQTISMLLISLVLMGGWIAGHSWIKKHHPEWLAQQEQASQEPAPQAPTQPASTQQAIAPTTSPSPGGTTGPATNAIANPGASLSAASPTGGFAVVPPDAANATPTVLGSDTLNDPESAMQLRLTPAGGAIDGIVLNQFRRSEDFKKKQDERGLYVTQSPYPDYPFAKSMGTRTITIDGKPVYVADQLWSLVGTGSTEKAISNQTVNGTFAKYATNIVGDNGNLLELTRTFTLFPKASPTLGYEIAIDYTVRNLSGGELTVSSLLNGPVLPPHETSRPPDRAVAAGFRRPDQTIHFPAPHGVEGLGKKNPTVDLTKDSDGNPVVWAGTSSVYFNAYVLFEQPDEIAKVAAEAKGVVEIEDPQLRPVLLTFETKPAKLAPGETRSISMTAFFGPRWREVLDTPYYMAAPRDYDQTLVVKSGPCGACAFDWLINGLVGLLNAFHWVAGGFPPIRAGDWGLAIILLVALVRTLLHPITKRSQMQMMKMGKMGPKMQKLKEKYGDDKEGFSKAQMQLMKEQGVGPLLGCLPMFLQMPIWIALWQALQSTFELRQAPFLWGFTWIKDLSKPDYLVKFDFNISLPFGLHFDGINLLPLLMAVIFNIQARIQNKLQPAATPEQESQKKMMLWMSTLLFPLFLYNGPSGLNLYILTSTLVGIIESKRIRDHIKEKEAAEAAAGLVVVDDLPPAKPVGKGSRGKLAVEEPVPERGGFVGFILGFIQRMQRKAEELQQRDQDRRSRKPK